MSVDGDGKRHIPGRNCTHGFSVDVDQLVQDHHSSGEDAIGMKEGVEKVNAQEAKIGQTLQQALHAGIADLKHFARIHGLAEADVNIITI